MELNTFFLSLWGCDRKVSLDVCYSFSGATTHKPTQSVLRWLQPAAVSSQTRAHPSLLPLSPLQGRWLTVWKRYISSFIPGRLCI